MSDEARLRPTRKEIDLYYKTHRSHFYAPERVHVLQIVKNLDEATDREIALAAMRSAQRELDRGVGFAEVADRYSDCAGNGGDLGWFPRDFMVEEFDAVVFELLPGSTSPIFETRFGLHIVRMLERRVAGVRPLSEVYEEIAEGLYAQRLKKARFA